MTGGSNSHMTIGLVALAASVVLAMLGSSAAERGSLVVYADGKMATMPVDDEMLRQKEFAFGPGGIFSTNPTAESQLEAMREANQAYKMRSVYYGGSAVAGMAAVWFLFAGWRARGTSPSR